MQDKYSPTYSQCKWHPQIKSTNNSNIKRKVVKKISRLMASLRPWLFACTGIHVVNDKKNENQRCIHKNDHQIINLLFAIKYPTANMHLLKEQRYNCFSFSVFLTQHVSENNLVKTLYHFVFLMLLEWCWWWKLRIKEDFQRFFHMLDKMPVQTACFVSKRERMWWRRPSELIF